MTRNRSDKLKIVARKLAPLNRRPIREKLLKTYAYDVVRVRYWPIGATRHGFRRCRAICLLRLQGLRAILPTRLGLLTKKSPDAVFCGGVAFQRRG